MRIIRLGQEPFCCRPGSFIHRPQKRVTTPSPHFPPSSIYFTTQPVRRQNSCTPFSLCCFDCSSFFIAPSAALWGLAICTVTGVLQMWVMGLLPVALPAATASRGNSHLCRSASWPLSYSVSFLSFFHSPPPSLPLSFCCNLTKERSSSSIGVSGSGIRRDLSCMFV